MDNHPDFDNCRYTLPGILHFLQHEWSQFELERAQWESEKAELQATIAFLQGERRGQENLKRDLIRRIKMLEFALKKERIKVSQMKGGESGNIPAPPELDGNESPSDEIPSEMACNQEGLGDLWSGGRQLLRQYLQEVGFTDTILDARSARLRALLGNSAPNDDDDDDNDNEQNARNYLSESGGVAVLDDLPIKDDDIQDAMEDFNFLDSENTGDWNPNTQVIDKKKEELVLERRRKPRPPRNNSPPQSARESNSSIFGQLQNSSQMNNNDNDSENKDINDDENEEELELGVLAGLTINNEADPLGLSDNSQFRRSWTHKYTLRSHLDGVRCVQFHPVEPLLVSASEDKVVKVWNLNRTVAGKKTQTADIDPIMNYRGHDEPVLSVVFGENEIYSSGLDGQIFGWPIPKLDADLYDPFDSEILGRKFEGHTDAVWNLDFQEQSLVSSSADGKIIVWDIPTGTPAITITAESLGMPELGIPVDARWSSEVNKLVAIWKGDKITTIDVTTGKIVLMLDECVEANAVCTHPLVPIAVTAHEDKHIRMWDLSSGILVHTCSAHADAVSTVAIDKTGAYLLTGGHDSSIRLWNIDTKVCVQEMTAHRPKNDEAVHYATFHINKGYVASAGADGLVKIFV